MKSFQKEIRLSAKSRGFHLVTQEILSQFSEIQNINVGMFHVFIKHTSASLTINENADPTVRDDFESHINKMVPKINHITATLMKALMICQHTSRPL